MRVTLKEIARELGVSHSTVSRVLNDKHSALVSEGARDRILEAARRMGYRPSRIAQALKGENTQLIGVFLPDGNDYFFQDVLANLCRNVECSGFELIPFASSGEKIADKWLRLLHWDLDGVFVFDYMLTLRSRALRPLTVVGVMAVHFGHGQECTRHLHRLSDQFVRSDDRNRVVDAAERNPQP